MLTDLQWTRFHARLETVIAQLLATGEFQDSTEPMEKGETSLGELSLREKALYTLYSEHCAEHIRLCKESRETNELEKLLQLMMEGQDEEQRLIVSQRLRRARVRPPCAWGHLYDRTMGIWFELMKETDTRLGRRKLLTFRHIRQGFLIVEEPLPPCPTAPSVSDRLITSRFRSGIACPGALYAWIHHHYT